MEILIGFGVLVAIAWLSLGWVLNSYERTTPDEAPGWLWCIALTPYAFMGLAVLTFVAWFIGTLLTGGFSG